MITPATRVDPGCGWGCLLLRGRSPQSRGPCGYKFAAEDVPGLFPCQPLMPWRVCEVGWILNPKPHTQTSDRVQGRVSPSWDTISAARHIFLMLANPVHSLTVTEVRRPRPHAAADVHVCRPLCAHTCGGEWGCVGVQGNLTGLSMGMQ